VPTIIRGKESDFSGASLQMPRKKSKGAKKPAGRKNDFVGSKLRLLENFADHWRQAQDCKKPSEFYSKITTLAVRQWGYHTDYSALPDEEDAEEDEDLPCEFSLLDNKDDSEEILTDEEVES
jgi:hypothetical protein